MGANLGSSADPVQLHIASRTDTDRTMPTTLVFTGRSGGGKSTAACLTLAGLLAEGAWALLVDNKGDLAGIVDTARRILGVTVQEIDVLDPACAGTMDPMRFAPTADEARTLTLDVLLGALSADDRRRGETVLEAAIDHGPAPAAEDRGPARPSSPPCTTSQRMTRTRWWRMGSPATLRVRAKTPQLRAVLGDLHAKARPLMTGRGLIYLRLDGLDLPRHTPDPGAVVGGAALLDGDHADRVLLRAAAVPPRPGDGQSRRADRAAPAHRLPRRAGVRGLAGPGRPRPEDLPAAGLPVRPGPRRHDRPARADPDGLLLPGHRHHRTRRPSRAAGPARSGAAVAGGDGRPPRRAMRRPGPAPAAHGDGVRPAHPVDRRHPVHRRRRRHPRPHTSRRTNGTRHRTAMPAPSTCQSRTRMSTNWRSSAAPDDRHHQMCHRAWSP